MLVEPEGHLHGGEHPAGRADQAKERRRRQTTTAYEMEEARMLEEKTVRSSMEQWGQAVSWSEQINLQFHLEKKHVELELSMGQGEQTCLQHDIFMEMNNLLEELIQPGREGKYHY